VNKCLYICFFYVLRIFAQSNGVDLLIYSMNRPMQLYALLESIEFYVSGYNEIHVLYRVTDKNYQAAYDVVKNRFQHVLFTMQGDHPELDFKPLMLQCAFQSSARYISFIVDDIIVTNYVDLNVCADALNRQTNAYAFFLRLGLNITESYTRKIKFLPPGKLLENNIYYWKFSEGGFNRGYGNLGDWNWATTNDFAIYRKADLKPVLEKLVFVNTGYEGLWWNKFRKDSANLDKIGLCFENSKVVNICVNLVQWDGPNWNQFSKQWREKKLSQYTPEKLLQKFNEGFRIDIHELRGIRNSAPHMEYDFKFIKVIDGA